MESRHAIRTVVRRTGLSPHVLRIWERRYGAVAPARTGTNRRLYSDEDIERLKLLRELTRAGHSIGLVATLPTAKLRRLAAEGLSREREGTGTAGDEEAKSLINECLAAIRALDSRELQKVLSRGAIAFGAQGLLQRVIAPLAHAIGRLWREGALTAAHEHFATAVIRVFLGESMSAFAAAENAPVLVTATPSGQLHELGALLAGAAASNLGWDVSYLGASLPAAEIAGAAHQKRARAVALSLVYPEDDPHLGQELLRLHELLPNGTTLLVGGRAMPAYRGALEKAGALPVEDLAHLCSILDSLRKPAKSIKR